MSVRHPSLAYAARAFLFSLGLLSLACSPTDPVVASVNGEEIRYQELKRQVRVFLSVRSQAADDKETQRQVLDQVIKQRLLVQVARQAKLDKDPKVLLQIQERRQALRRELEKSIANAQAQLQGLDDAVEARTLIEALSQAERVSMTVTTKDLQAAYKNRASLGPLPPFSQVRDQILEQVVLDRLVDQARSHSRVDVKQDALR